MRVLVGTGRFLLREALTHVLDSQPGYEMVGCASTEPSVIDAIDRQRPHVVVVAAALAPGYTDEGVRIAVRARHENPRIGFVVLGDAVRPAHLLQLVADGVAGRAYLLTERIERGEEILDAIRAVASGGSVVDPIVMERLAAAPDESALLGRLTARELDVLSLMAEGGSNFAIAARLGLTKRAVEKHVGEIFARLELADGADVSRRVAAALLFLRATGRLALSG